MCGIFGMVSSNPDLLEKTFIHRQAIEKTIRLRGPDQSSFIRGENFLALHTLLSITGSTLQPVLNDKFLLMFNGEIYNDYLNYRSDYGDTQFMTSLLLEDGEKAFRILDGEFSIFWFNFETSSLYLVTDPFGTKPLYYQLGKDYCIVGTYESTVATAGQEGPIKQVPANTILEIGLDNFYLRSINMVHAFDFTQQDIDSFEPWTEAFANAVRKRMTNNRQHCFVSLSSGHDSGLIAAESLRLQIPFAVYIAPYGEDKEILQRRIEVLNTHNVPVEIIQPSEEDYQSMKCFVHDHCEAFQLINTENEFKNFKDPDMRNIPGYIVSAIIHQKARAVKRLISLSGQGADEIYADYYNPYANPNMSELKGNWANITHPWSNFYAGWNRVFLGAGERIAGLFGIETRYPFLDCRAVQEFLNLHPKLKGRYYKSPVTNRLLELSFPYHNRKFGFAGFPAILA